MGERIQIPAEPPNRSIVGWGHPPTKVRVRIDEYAHGEDPDERWFGPDADDDSPTLTWTQCCVKFGEEPYLLVEQPLRRVFSVPVEEAHHA